MSQDIYNVANSWVIVPAPWKVNAPPVRGQQMWLMTLTGTADVNFRGNSTTSWRTEIFRLHLDWASPVTFAYGNVPGGKSLAFRPNQWAPYAGLSSVYDAGPSVEAGYAVEAVAIALNGNKDLVGLEVAVKARDTDAFVYKVGFQLTVLGSIMLYDTPN